MLLLEHTVTAPEENLALDEALLYFAEEREQECMRFWESPAHFVVLGAGGAIGDEADFNACVRRGIPILRRCTGGGTVVQGPGCLNYVFVLDSERRDGLKSIASTNQTVLATIADAMAAQGIPVSLEGISDLTRDGLKISGNAQRRRKRFILFHGTLLHAFDLSLIPALLREPQRQPEYRAKRAHAEFVRNLEFDTQRFRADLAEKWKATPLVGEWPRDLMVQLIEEKYSKRSWNFSF